MVFPVCGQAVKKPSVKTASTQSKKTSPAAKPTAAKQLTAKQPGKTPAKKPAVEKQTAQKTVSRPKKPVVAVVDDKKEFETASAIENPAQRIAALKKFVNAFPESTLLDQARELLSSTAYASGEERFAAGDIPAAIDLYKLAVSSAPTPIPATLFNDSLSKIPNVLYWRGDRAEAIDIAKTLESRIGSDSDQFAALSMFYVGIENGDEAVRLAEAAVRSDPAKSRSYGVLGLAERVNFKLDESAAAYAKALELDPDSTSLKRNLAEIKRATGKADDAVSLYKDAVAADPNDLLSQNGLVLSLFDAGKTDEAEKAMAASLEQNPNNVMLIAGAAYWYAAHKNDEKAIELARRAISVEPRYIWGHIALGRALMLQNRPVEAEEALLKARAYGNFPTLEYEIASARAMAGFYRDAVEGLARTFTIADDSVVTKIGGRVERKGASFTDILADERRASILEPTAADDADTATRLKELLALNAALNSAKPDEAAVTKAADAFVAGTDNSKYHRQLYASSLLLEKKIAVDKALEYAEAAVGNSDTALTIANAGAYVMASELYDSRQLALSRDEFLKVPDVPRPTLAAILRGRIEDLIGWALVEENKPADAEVHFKRSVAILPEKSAWWRASMWRYGTALQANGKESEALDAYIKSYSIDKPDIGRYTTVETLYKKLNGSTEGLEAKVGASPLPSADVLAKNDPSAAPAALPASSATPNIDLPQPTPTPAAAPEPSPISVSEKKEVQQAKAVTPNEVKPTDTTGLKVDTAASTEPEPPPAIKRPEPKTITSAEIEAKATPEVTPAPTPTPQADPSTNTETSTAASPSPTPTADAASSPSPTPDLSQSPAPEATPAPAPDETAVKPDPSPSPSPSAPPLPEAATTPTPEPTVTPEPTPTTEKIRDANDPATTNTEPSPSPTPTTVSEPETKTEATPEPSPTTETENGTEKRRRTEVVVSSKVPLPTPTVTPDDKTVAEVTKKGVIDKPTQPQTSSSPRPLFEPVVITIPKSDTTKPPDRPSSDINRGAADGRSRLVDGQPVQAIEPPPCQISVSQEKLSLLNNGGTLAVLVGVEKGERLDDLKFVVSDPDDISVKFEPDISGISGRSLYVITSTSERTGDFRLTFYLPCGKKNIAINVR